jgi:hypothetical protein
MVSQRPESGQGSQILKSFFKYLLLLGLALWLGLTSAQRSAHAAADDDWEAVASTTTSRVEVPTTPERSDKVAPADAIARDGTEKPFKVCGEMATDASPQVASMVERIDELWGSNFRAYQTVLPEQPHASTGGCVFYNPKAMAAIMMFRLGVQDTNVVDPLAWAIFAHEIGHQVHRDTESVRASVPSETKELEADRFAGYTLEKLKIRATDLSPYWSLTGDEFGGRPNARNVHGSSSQRLAAFKQGWNLAEWNRPEDSVSVADAQDEAVAPDNADGAPK